MYGLAEALSAKARAVVRAHPGFNGRRGQSIHRLRKTLAGRDRHCAIQAIVGPRLRARLPPARQNAYLRTPEIRPAERSCGIVCPFKAPNFKSCEQAVK